MLSIRCAYPFPYNVCQIWTFAFFHEVNLIKFCMQLQEILKLLKNIIPGINVNLQGSQKNYLDMASFCLAKILFCYDFTGNFYYFEI